MENNVFSRIFLIFSLFFYFFEINSMPVMPMPGDLPPPPTMPVETVSQLPEVNLTPTQMPVAPVGSTDTPIQTYTDPTFEEQSIMPISQQSQMEVQEVSTSMPMIGGSVMGAETVSLQDDKVGTQGNWVKKREWLKYSLEVNDEIQSLVDEIKQSRGSYLNKINSIDNELDNFYREIGFKQGELQAVFNELLKYLEKRRQKKINQIKTDGQKEGVTSEMEVKIDIVEDEIKTMKNNLEQFKLDMKSVEELDKSLQDRIRKLDEQIGVSEVDAKKANDLVNEIWKMIDDKKARLAYYELKGNLFEKIKVLKTYVQTTLMSNLDSVLSSIRSQITQLRSGITNLESNGFIIINRAKKLEQLKLEELDALRAGQPIKKDIKPEKEVLKHKNIVYDFFVDVAANIYKNYKLISSFFKELIS